jgi:hypothetical protein
MAICEYEPLPAGLLRSTTNPASMVELSFHDRLICVEEAAVAASVSGAAGSPHPWTEFDHSPASVVDASRIR